MPSVCFGNTMANRPPTFNELQECGAFSKANSNGEGHTDCSNVAKRQLIHHDSVPIWFSVCRPRHVMGHGKVVPPTCVQSAVTSGMEQNNVPQGGRAGN